MMAGKKDRATRRELASCAAVPETFRAVRPSEVERTDVEVCLCWAANPPPVRQYEQL